MSTLPPTTPPVTYTYATTNPQTVVISDINMSIGAMCRFMIKWAIAAIPALIAIWFIMFVLAMIVAVAFGGIFHALLGPYPIRL